jgi:Fe2+ transport system protein FeoA
VPAEQGVRPDPLSALRLRERQDAGVDDHTHELDPPMTMVRLLKSTLRGVASWKESCVAGSPVPGRGCLGLDCESVRLTALGPGKRGSVACLEEPWTAEAAKLASLGILPGVRLRVVQRFPVWVVRMGRAEIALDAGLAGRVRVISRD